MRRAIPAAVRAALAALVSVAATAPAARAQTFAVPDFEIATPSFAERIADVDVAASADGTITFLWGEYDHGTRNASVAVTRQFTPAGTALGPAVRIDTSKHVVSPMISADTRGGWVAAWWWIISGQEYAYFGQTMDAAGAPLGDDFKIDFENAGAAKPGGVAGLPSGAVYTWVELVNRLWGRRYDTAGQPIGDAFEIGIAGAGFNQDLVATPDGGFVATWTNTWESTFSWARAYGPDGQPLGDAFTVGPDDFHLQHVAASPLGGLVGAGYRWNAALAASEVWIVRFTTAGATLGAHRVEIPPPGVAVDADVAIDALGKIYTTWSEYQVEGAPALRAPRARAFDPDGNPIIFGFWPTLTKVSAIATAAVGDGRFVNIWIEQGAATANVVEIPPPAGVVCGDGVLTPGFEECDDGAANSDTTPNACRTNCLLPGCGDEVTDASEECDDGNAASCDGCSASCVAERGPVCGDGVVEPSCGEACDDGNTTSRDGCGYDCQVEPCMTCTGTPSLCTPRPPAPSCRAPVASGKSKLGLKRHPTSRDGDKLAWAWKKGAETVTTALGDPTAATGYELCVFDGAGPTTSLVLATRAPAGGTCDGKPCWTAIGGGAGYKYRSKSLGPDGLQSLLIKGGEEGRAKVIVKGRGAFLHLPPLPLAQSPLLTVQLTNDAGQCWGDTYTAPAAVNQSAKFKDAGD